MKTKIIDLKNKLQEKEDSLQFPDIDKLLAEITDLENKVKELQAKHENGLKLKHVLDRANRFLGHSNYGAPSSKVRVFAKDSEISEVEELLKLESEDLPRFAKEKDYGFSNGWRVI
jgi:hypothetical protein